jgi:predicted O-methyltransferase YrrM
MLFGLAVSIRAKTIIEIGRWRGFSTLALAGALKFVDAGGWTVPESHLQRPGVDYQAYLAPAIRTLYSIENEPLQVAVDLIEHAKLMQYVNFVDQSSDGCDLGDVQADLVFIDGDHSYEATRRDIDQYVKRYLRPGGYFVLHDYFGWYDEHGNNGSAVARIVQEIRGEYEQILIDTGYMSLVILRKPL